MKQILTIALVFAFFLGLNQTIQAQDELKFPDLDASPMDMAYFPSRVTFRGFAKTDEEKNAKPVMRIAYSRPQAKGRKVFGELEKFGTVWRLGANENAELMLFKNVTVGGAKLKKGKRYAVFALLGEKEWEIHFSDDLDRWGAYVFDPAQSTVAKIKVPVEKTPSTVEAFSIIFKDVADGAHMIMAWDDTMVRVPFVFKK